MHSDYSERRNTDFEHIVRGAEHSKKHLWYELKAAKPTKSRQNAVIMLTFIVLTIRFLFCAP